MSAEDGATITPMTILIADGECSDHGPYARVCGRCLALEVSELREGVEYLTRRIDDHEGMNMPTLAEQRMAEHVAASLRSTLPGRWAYVTHLKPSASVAVRMENGQMYDITVRTHHTESRAT